MADNNQTQSSKPITPSIKERFEAAKAVLDKLISEHPERKASATVGEYGADRVVLSSEPEDRLHSASDPPKPVATFALVSIGVLALTGAVAIGWSGLRQIARDKKRASEEAAKQAAKTKP